MRFPSLRMFRRCRRKPVLSMLLACVAAVFAMGQSASAQGTGYWHTSGNQILDSSGSRVRIAGINWYGFETTDQVAHGLYDQDYHAILNTIHSLGYNTIRLPFSNQMVEHPIVPTAFATESASGPINADLTGLSSLAVMDKVISAAGVLGIKVILDNHRSEAGNSNEANGLWYTGSYPETKWIADWQTLATRYKSFVDAKGNPIVIGMDLRNEPHLLAGGAKTGSCWTGDTWTNGCSALNTAQNWPAAAGRAAKAILSINAGLLIFVEGTDCYSGDCGWQGANLEGAKAYPVTLSTAGRLVYSAHDYGPDLSKQSWFSSSTTSASLNAAWTKYWAYLSVNDIAPVWVGEFGTTNTAGDLTSNSAGSQGQWFSALVGYLGNQPNIEWTYWALNGEDPFGLLNGNYSSMPDSSQKQQMLESIEFPLSGVGGTVPCAVSPTAPAAVKASAGSSSIQLAWNGVTPPADCTVTYTVFRGTASGFAASSSSQFASGLTVPAYSDGSVKTSTTYYYLVEAFDAHGGSAASPQASAKTSSATGGPACHITYALIYQWTGGFQAGITIENSGTTSLSNWKLQWTFAGSQKLTSAWNGTAVQTGAGVTFGNEGYNGAIAPGSSVGGIGFAASYSGTNAVPASFTLNGVVCK